MIQTTHSLFKPLLGLCLGIALTACDSSNQADAALGETNVNAYGPGTIVEATVISDDGQRDAYILADEFGQPLYWYAHDLGTGNSECVAEGGCLGRWPIYGVSTTDSFEQFSILDREDDEGQQWMFIWSATTPGENDLVFPLYHWVGDVRPDETTDNIIANGEVGFTNWHVIEFSNENGEFTVITDPNDFPPN